MRFEILNEQEHVIDTIEADFAFMQSQYEEWQYRQVPDLPIVPTIPQSITMRQARLALRRQGLYEAVGTAINALPDPHKTDAIIEWEYSNEVQRSNGFVSDIAPGLGLSDQDIDNLFLLGATL